ENKMDLASFRSRIDPYKSYSLMGISSRYFVSLGLQMNAERQRQIEHIYHAAVGMPTGEREAFCKRSCNGDDYLWHEVQSLLAFENSSDPSLRDSHQPAARRVAGLKEQASFAGRDIGHYKIERLLGRGGMGDVYLAKDTKLNRKIALK